MRVLVVIPIWVVVAAGYFIGRQGWGVAEEALVGALVLGATLAVTLPIAYALRHVAGLEPEKDVTRGTPAGVG